MGVAIHALLVTSLVSGCGVPRIRVVGLLQGLGQGTCSISATDVGGLWVS